MKTLLLCLCAGALAAQVPTDHRSDSPAVPSDVQVDKNVAYDQHPETVMDIFQPKAAGKGKRPGVIVVHGGGWTGGTKEQRIPVCLRYVAKGFVCADVEYRLAKAATAPAAVTDALDALSFFAKNAKKYDIDTKRLVVTGDSAGGHLSLMMGMTPKSAKLGPVTPVAAVVDFYGITDVGDQLDGPNMRPYAVTWLPDQPERLEIADRVSPMTYVRKGLPPILAIHGDADPTVPYDHSVKLIKALRDKGDDAELVSVPGGKHGFPQDQVDQIFEKQVWPFLTRVHVLR